MTGYAGRVADRAGARRTGDERGAGTMRADRSGTTPRPLAALVALLLLSVAGCAQAPRQGGPAAPPPGQQQGERGTQGEGSWGPAPTSEAPGGVAAAPGPHSSSAPRGGRTEARFELVSGVARVNLRSADIGDDLYRIATADDSGLAPRVSVSADTVRLALQRTGLRGPETVDIELSRQVRWLVRLAAGAGEQRLDLADGPVSGVEINAGAALIDLSLPRPDGTVPVRMGGSAGRFDLRAPVGVPVRVRLAGGAGTVSVDGDIRAGVGGGTVLTPDGWGAAADRYEVEALAGVAALTVAR